MSVDVKTKLVEGIVILQPLGNMLEAVDGENLLNETHNYLGEYSKFILDCSEIKHLNSTGINNILKVFTQIRNHGGEMILCAIPIQIEKLLIIIF